MLVLKENFGVQIFIQPLYDQGLTVIDCLSHIVAPHVTAKQMATSGLPEYVLNTELINYEDLFGQRIRQYFSLSYV